MRFDVRNSPLVPWLTIVSAAIAIGGLLIQVFGGQTFLAFLRVAVPIPLWVLLATLCFAPAVTMFVAQRIIRAADSRSQTLAESTRLAAETCVRESQAQLATLQARLDEYESLEREILGLLASGLEIEPQYLVNKLSLSLKRDGDKMVRLAVASLQAQGKVVGTGPISPKLKLAAR